ncbi:GH1 family beta-glucosidase [Myxococcota bacterium]|nr:GH1 family beta-glucosidase [Myxococcota bacterium]
MIPRDFLFGVATSAHQIEGATREDGRGECIWDRFSATPGRIEDASTAAVACDHYHRWPEDLGLMRELGVDAYRFSIAWPRIFPTGAGEVNERGLAFYDRLVDALLEAKIRPFVTLYHWDLPQALQDVGGWTVRSVVPAFERYTEAVARRLGDRVKDWVTINEPWCIAVLGHAEGKHAPGHARWPEALLAAHHAMLAHGRAVKVLRRLVPGVRAGITLNLVPGVPASDSLWDVDACRKFDGGFNRWYLDPVFGRGYPIDAIADLIAAGHLDSTTLPFVHPGDLEEMGTPTDFLGVNYYSRGIIRSHDVPEHENAPRRIPEPPKDELTEMGWEVWAPGLTDLLLRVHRDYAPKSIYITENGAAYSTGPGPDGRIHDTLRVRFLEEHLAECGRSIARGVPVHGYFHWSLLDNFEWGHGYTKRFGLAWVDYATGRRTLKDSGRRYAELIRQTRGLGR